MIDGRRCQSFFRPAMPHGEVVIQGDECMAFLTKPYEITVLIESIDRLAAAGDS